MKTSFWFWISVAFAASFALGAGFFVASKFGGVFGLVTFVSLFSGFIGQAIYEVRVDPPQVIIVTIFGSPTDTVKRPGLRLLPFQGLIFGSQVIETKIVNEDLPDVGYFTQDKVPGKAPIAISWQPLADEGKMVRSCDGRNVHALLNFIDAGKQEGVKDLLSDKAISAFVHYMRSVKTWEDALGVENSATMAILKAITGEEGMPSIPSSVPTNMLMKYYRYELSEYTEKDKARYAAEADINDEIRKEIIADSAGVHGNEVRSSGHPIYEVRLKELIKDRHENLSRLKSGRGTLDLPDFGIRLTRLNIGERKPDEKVVEAGKKKVIETLEAEAERVQSDSRTARAIELAGSPNSGMDTKEAFRLQLVDAGKIPNADYQSYDFNLKVSADEATSDLLGKVVDAAKVIVPGVAATKAATKKTDTKKGGAK